MKVIITSRHFEVSDELKKYAEKKLIKLEKYFHKLIDIRATMYMEKHNHIIDVVINADGARFHGNESSNDMYSSVDMVVKSMENQVSKHKEKHSGHKAVSPGKVVTFDTGGDDRIEVKLNYTGNKPKNDIEAYLEMKMDKSEFILFKKLTTDKKGDPKAESYAMIYTQEDQIRMTEIPAEMIKKNKYDSKKFLEFEVIVKDDSASNPKIKFKKSRTGTIENLTMSKAVEVILSSGIDFIPYFNSETSNFNIIYKTGDTIEVIIPPEK